MPGELTVTRKRRGLVSHTCPKQSAAYVSLSPPAGTSPFTYQHPYHSQLPGEGERRPGKGNEQEIHPRPAQPSRWQIAVWRLAMVHQPQVRAAGARPILERRAVLAQETLCLAGEAWRAGLWTTEGLSRLDRRKPRLHRQ